MENNFEKQVREQGDQFELKPSNGVWNRIETELDRKKTRRIVGWWWAAPLLLLAGGGIYWLSGPKQQKNQQTIIAKNSERAKTSPSAAVDNKGKKGTATDLTNNQTAKPEGPKKEEFKPNAPKPLENSKKQAFSQKKRNNHAANNMKDGLTLQQSESATSNYSKNHTNKPGVLLPAPTTQNELTKTNRGSQTITEPHFFPENRQSLPHTTLATWEASKTDLVANATHPAATIADSNAKTLISVKAVQEQAVPQNLTPQAVVNSNAFPLISEVSAPVIPASSKKTTQKGWLAASLALGQSNLYQSNSLFKSFQSRSQDFVFDNSVGTGNNNSGAFQPIKPNKAGLSIGAGISYLLPIAKRWQWHNAVNYQYQSMQQFTGNRKDSTVSTQNFANSSTREKNVTSNYFYYPGSSIQHRGTNHRIGLQTSLTYQLINRKYKLGLGFGLYGAANLQHNYLAMDYQNRRMIPSTNKQKAINAGTAMQLVFTTPKKFQYGLQFQNDFTAAHPAFGSKKYYWRTLQANFSFPLNKK